MATKKVKATGKPAAKDTSNTLPVKLGPDETEEQKLAALATEGMVNNADLVRRFNVATFGDLHLAGCLRALSGAATAVHGGDLKGAESLLVAQAAALNAMFGELARRSALNMGEHLDATDRYMRLALKAQSQCRATLEALAEIKNPRPVAFVKQANISNGPQQVNNGIPAPPAGAHGQGWGETLPAPGPGTALPRTERAFSAGGDIQTAGDAKRLG